MITSVPSVTLASHFLRGTAKSVEHASFPITKLRLTDGVACYTRWIVHICPWLHQGVLSHCTLQTKNGFVAWIERFQIRLFGSEYDFKVFSDLWFLWSELQPTVTVTSGRGQLLPVKILRPPECPVADLVRQWSSPSKSGTCSIKCPENDREIYLKWTWLWFAVRVTTRSLTWPQWLGRGRSAITKVVRVGCLWGSLVSEAISGLPAHVGTIFLGCFFGNFKVGVFFFCFWTKAAQSICFWPRLLPVLLNIFFDGSDMQISRINMRGCGCWLEVIKIDVESRPFVSN